MSEEKKSTTKEDCSILYGKHYKTTISEGEKKVEGLGNTSKESQETASRKWDRNYGNED